MSIRPVLLGLALLATASCSEPQAPDGVAGEARTLHLLARGPDALVEQVGTLLPVGDLPGTITWGPQEGPGWSSEEHRLADNTPYLRTNQATAKLDLPVLESLDRELELYLWVDVVHEDGPHPVEVRLNGTPLGALHPGTTPDPKPLRIHAPGLTWLRGDNQLELVTPTTTTPDGPRWETLALAALTYAPAARVTLDLDGARATLPPLTGLRTSVWQRAPAELRVTATSPGDGTLVVLLGDMDLVDGKRSEIEREELELRSGHLDATLSLALHRNAVRVVELEWRPAGSTALTLETLDVVEPGPPAAPPIVLVSIDTFAARHLSLYGYERPTSPVLDAFQTEAIVFEQCNANAPWTMPSYLSVMTGLYPKAHHVLGLAVQPGVDLNNWDWYQVAPNRWTLAEALRARGYRTAGFIDTFWLSPQFGVAQGFDHYDGEAALRPFQDSTAGIGLIVGERVPPWLARGPADVPEFLFVHALDAHGPYIPEAPWGGTFASQLPDERQEVAAGAIHQSWRGMPDWMARTLLLDESQPLPAEVPLDDVVAAYDETLLKVDSYLGRLFELLRQQGLYDEAVIVITGDHGEHFGPDVYGHGVMHGDVLQVPLIVRLPGGQHGGTRVAAPVQLVDLYPTLLELAGAPVHEDTGLHGHSLLAHLSGQSGPAFRYSEAGWVEAYALTEGRWKLVEERPGSESSPASVLTHPRVPPGWIAEHFPELAGRPLSAALMKQLEARPDFAARIAELRELVAGPYYALHDLQDDPREQHDRSTDEPDVLARLRARLEEEKARSQAARAHADPDQARRELGAAAREQLDALGYGGGD
jgi:arylsulfatase A-like enzyme